MRVSGTFPTANVAAALGLPRTASSFEVQAALDDEDHLDDLFVAFFEPDGERGEEAQARLNAMADLQAQEVAASRGVLAPGVSPAPEPIPAAFGHGIRNLPELLRAVEITRGNGDQPALVRACVEAAKRLGAMSRIPTDWSHATGVLGASGKPAPDEAFPMDAFLGPRPLGY